MTRIDVAQRDDLEKFLMKPSSPKLVPLHSLAKQLLTRRAVESGATASAETSAAQLSALSYFRVLKPVLDDLKAGTLTAYARNVENDELDEIEASYWDDGGNALTQRGLAWFLESDEAGTTGSKQRVVLKREDAIAWLQRRAAPTVLVIDMAKPDSNAKPRTKPNTLQARYDRLPRKGKQCVDWALELLNERGGLTPANPQSAYEREVEARAEFDCKGDAPSESSIRRYVKLAIAFYEAAVTPH